MCHCGQFRRHSRPNVLANKINKKTSQPQQLCFNFSFSRLAALRCDTAKRCYCLQCEKQNSTTSCGSVCVAATARTFSHSVTLDMLREVQGHLLDGSQGPTAAAALLRRRCCCATNTHTHIFLLSKKLLSCTITIQQSVAQQQWPFPHDPPPPHTHTRRSDI